MQTEITTEKFVSKSTDGKTWKSKVSIALVAFVFSALGGVVSQVFVAGTYANQIKTNTEQVGELQKNLEFHKTYDNNTYLKKEVFDEFKSGEHRMLMEQMKKIDDKIDRLLERK